MPNKETQWGYQTKLHILQVLLARHRKHGGYYAVKVLRKQMIVQRKEVHFLTYLTHPAPGAFVFTVKNPSCHFVSLAAEACDG